MGGAEGRRDGVGRADEGGRGEVERWTGREGRRDAQPLYSRTADGDANGIDMWRGLGAR